MSNEFKLVPVEQTSEMTLIGQRLRYDAVNSIGEIYRQMISRAPQPPALGGEPETLAVFKADGSSLHQTKAGFERQLTGLDVELIDRAHLAPLQDEIERQDQELDDRAQWDTAQIKVIHGLNDDVAKLKARCDELHRMLGLAWGDGDVSAEDCRKIDAALSKPAGSEQV